ncbi:MAG: helix-turn-helix transcriptional regulator [Nitrososphaerales archaeon]
MQSVRRRITEILKEHGSATVAELADELGMAQVSVRHHLDILVGEDLVELTGVRRRDGVGRPSQVYALTPNALALFPQRTAQLAASVLAELKAVLPQDQVANILLRIAERTAAEAPQPIENQTLEERLDQVTGFLTQKGYSARWESCDGYYELHACNCPYSGVAEEHPELCMMDHAMILRLLPDAVRSDCIRLHSRAVDGANRCSYILKPVDAPAFEQPVEGN